MARHHFDDPDLEPELPVLAAMLAPPIPLPESAAEITLPIVRAPVSHRSSSQPNRELPVRLHTPLWLNLVVLAALVVLGVVIGAALSRSGPAVQEPMVTVTLQTTVAYTTTSTSTSTSTRTRVYTSTSTTTLPPATLVISGTSRTLLPPATPSPASTSSTPELGLGALSPERGDVSGVGAQGRLAPPSDTFSPPAPATMWFGSTTLTGWTPVSTNP